MGIFPKSNDRCLKCGESWRRLVTKALMSDAGAYIGGTSPEYCREGGDHKWPEENKEEAQDADRTER